ncbi:MAG TPA: FAD-dependent oxidoreductase, partial [Acidimicrobiales bacterium]|nr:FAD-dependent oxidoreductase [Acidimicrobiales bacterium]
FVSPPPADFHLQGRVNGVSVLVLGAVVSGLACAYELEKGGYDVTVVEARERVGGRNLTVRRGTTVVDSRGTRQRATFARGRYFNAGPARIAAHHTTLDYCRELGVAVEPFINVNPDAYIVDGDLVRRRRSVDADLDGYITELLVKAVADGALDAELTEEEAGALYDHLRAIGALAASERGYERHEGPGAGGRAGVIRDPDDLLTVLAFDLVGRRGFERNWHLSTPMFHPVGGMDAIPTAFAEALRRPVRTGSPVVEVRDGGGVRATLADGTVLEADYGVCTLPPQLSATLEGDWDDSVRTALNEPVSVTTGKLGLEYDRRFWELDDRILGGITSTDREPREIWYPSHDYLAVGGVVVGAYPFGPAADRFSRLRHDARTQVATEAGVAVHGDVYRDGVVSSFSVDWRSQDFSVGGWSDFLRYGQSYDVLSAGVGRWRFAGDWLSRASGWQHGALESARLAVTGLHETALAD